MPQAAAAAVEWIAGSLWEIGAIETGTAVGIMANSAAIANTALLVGGLAYSASKARSAKQAAKDAYNASQTDRLVNIESTTAPRDLVLGRVRKGGAVVYKASTGPQQQELFMVIAFAGHEIDAYEQFYLNDEPVTLDGSGNVQEAPWASLTTDTTTQTSISGSITLPASYVAGSAYYLDANGDATTPSIASLVATVPIGFTLFYQYTTVSAHLKITAYTGAAGQTADPDLIAAFPSDWTSANVGQGVAYVVMHCSYSEDNFPSGLPKLTAVIRGAKCYDPRTATTAWTENPAIMMRHVYTHARFGKASPSAAEDARFNAAANACDTSTVYTVGGVAQPSRALFKAAIAAPFGTTAKSLFDDLVQAMGGSWAFAGGELYIKPGQYTASVMSLTEADLASVKKSGSGETSTPLAISVHKERAQKINSIKPTIYDAAQDYKNVPLTPLTPSAYVTADGGVELVQELQFPAVGYAPQALHLAGIILRDARDPLVFEADFKLRTYPLELFDTVDLTLTRFGWSAKTFMVIGRVFNGDGTIHLTLKETSAAITQMDAGFSAQGFAANTNLPSPWTVAAVGPLTITSGTTELLTQLDGTIVSRMRVSWPTVLDAAVVANGVVEVQYRAAGSTGEWSKMEAAGDATSIATTDVQDGAWYVIRARARTRLGVGNWCTQVTHQVIGKTAAPDAFDVFTIAAQPDGTRQYNFGYTTTAKPADWLGAEIRYISGTTATPTWADMTPLQDGTTYYTHSPVELNAPLSGVWTFAAKSLDTTGNESTYKVVNITLPDRRLGNVFDEFFEHTDGWLGTLSGCHVQAGYLEANDSTTWATLPATWAAWTRWNTTPTSPITYTTPVRDFGTVIAGQINSTVDADGTVVTELATSADGTTWSAFSSAASPFSTRYLKLRITVTATGPAPVPLVRSWYWQVNAPMRSEYLNDIVPASLTGSYRIGTGDIRIPLAGVYTVIKRTDVVIQDSSAGTWTCARIDQSLSPSPRWQFRLNGTLADPAFVDFYIEGY